MEETEFVRVNPNVKTYTTLIHGWACVSLLEKALRCFEQMKSAGLKPDKAVYHCLMTSLMSKASVDEEYIYSGILSPPEDVSPFPNWNAHDTFNSASHIEDSHIDNVNRDDDDDDDDIYYIAILI
ncbi:hypothetical protein RJ639_024263 [Escallonia herrerae]|uniref:Pentatricopeptide repeat-containing protein n=1 Tax=Escallonia herrerae TaxID=1293975 RepID=A0AA88V209_9ASTE|nr:hypothetical protein RJ639_024263 [Escallonia herrerae]